MQELDLGNQPEGGKGTTSLLGGHHSNVQARTRTHTVTYAYCQRVHKCEAEIGPRWPSW